MRWGYKWCLLQWLVWVSIWQMTGIIILVITIQLSFVTENMYQIKSTQAKGAWNLRKPHKLPRVLSQRNLIRHNSSNDELQQVFDVVSQRTSLGFLNFVFLELRVASKVLSMLGKFSTTELHPQYWGDHIGAHTHSRFPKGKEVFSFNHTFYTTILVSFSHS
jgi:hypothetical protein